MWKSGRNPGKPAVFFCANRKKRVAFYVNSFYTKTQGWGKVEPFPTKRVSSGGEVNGMTGI